MGRKRVEYGEKDGEKAGSSRGTWGRGGGGGGV